MIVKEIDTDDKDSNEHGMTHLSSDSTLEKRFPVAVSELLRKIIIFL